MEQEDSLSPLSLKQKLKSSLTLLCFPHKERDHHHHRETLTPDSKSRLIRTSSNPWIKGRPHHDIPELKDKCRHLFSRIGGGSRPARRHSADFRYDALSYALNFDEGCDDKHLDEYPFRNFSSRLPPSPSREIRAL